MNLTPLSPQQNPHEIGHEARTFPFLQNFFRRLLMSIIQAQVLFLFFCTIKVGSLRQVFGVKFGVKVGIEVGEEVGVEVGEEVGVKVGIEVGEEVGVEVGEEVGMSVGVEGVGGFGVGGTGEGVGLGSAVSSQLLQDNLHASNAVIPSLFSHPQRLSGIMPTYSQL